MKILILVLSYNSPPFDVLMRTQQSSWDSVEVEGIKTVYYHGGCDPENILTDRFAELVSDGPSWLQMAFKCTDAYYYMSSKFKKALEWVDLESVDYIFRTNSSSYVNKKALVEFAKTLPKEKLYAGWEINGNEGFNIISGAGFFLSRDTAKILMDNIDPSFEKEEDYYCAKILHEHGIKIIDDKSRYDVNEFHPYIPTDLYHYRFKGPHGNRLIDAHNMIMLHKKINS